MNDRYFACWQCKTYVDAGYRWAYWMLEHPGIVRLGHAVSVEAVLSAAEYWSPFDDGDSRWLLEDVLPRVRRYLAAHGEHGIIYIESDLVFNPDGPYAEWVEVVDA